MCRPEIPLADGGSLTTGPSADSQVGFEIGRLPKPQWRIRGFLFYLHMSGLSDVFSKKASLARIIVYSMAPDGIPVPQSNAPTPVFSPLPSGVNTPRADHNNLGDYLSASLGKQAAFKERTYLGGSIALDSLARMVASTESFFHPSNSGSWTNDVSTVAIVIDSQFDELTSRS